MEQIATAAGVKPSWVERFAPPVYAEQAQVVARVIASPLHRARLGESALVIGAAVARNLADRGLVLSPGRSEEHTSELQSLMRISYAVFCLKKTTTQSIRGSY